MAIRQSSTETDIVVDLVDSESADADPHASAVPLAAAHFILSPARQKTENEIIGVTVLEILRAGPLALSEVTSRCQQMWPGSGVTPQQVEIALETAKLAGWVTDSAHPQSRMGVWGHTGAVIADLEEAQIWARNVVTRTRSQLRDAISDAGFDVQPDRLDLWFDLLWGAICSGAAEGSQVFSGGVTRLADGSLTPAVFDMAAARQHIFDGTQNSDVQRFLSSMIEAAIDKADVFGNELVSSVCAGYLLHAFLARRDFPKARRKLGSIAGRRVVIDTPWLITVCGSGHALASFQAAMKVARNAGIEVIVADHTVEELHDVVARAESEIVGIAAEIRNGLDPHILLASLPGDQSLVAVWLAYAVEAEDFEWASFYERVGWIVSKVIPDCGIVVRPHGNDRDEEVARVNQAVEALKAALSDSGSKRGSEQIRRDAQTMVLASRPRRLRSTASDFWPMGWVVTRDRRMDKAYQRLLETEEPSLTLTPSQFVYLLAAGASGKREQDLAAAVSDIFIREASLGVAVQWPPGMLLDIAKSLHPETGITVTDVRLSHRSFDDLLREQPDILNDPREAGARLIAMAVAERGRRLEGVRNHRLARAEDRADSAETELGERRRVSRVDRRANVDLTEALLAEKAQREEGERLKKRGSIIQMLLVALGVAGIWAATATEWWVVGGMIATGAVLWLSSRRWTKDLSVHWHEMLVALLGLTPLLKPFADDIWDLVSGN